MKLQSDSTLVVAVGDIHGRFSRVDEWIKTLATRLEHDPNLVVAVGDIEAFQSADEHLRKAVRKKMPADFADYAAGTKKLSHPIYFIAGNNEDFEALYPVPSGAEIAKDTHYLGRAGTTTLAGLKIAFLSGIYAPKSFDQPIEPPRTAETSKRNGYFRASEIATASGSRSVDLMLVHEWPRGVVARAKAQSRGVNRSLRAYRFPWIGNVHTRTAVDSVQPSWLLCGHSHVAYAARIDHADGATTQMACLDQAAKPDGSIFWMEWNQGRVRQVGWGITGESAWSEGQTWDESRTPPCGDEGGVDETDE